MKIPPNQMEVRAICNSKFIGFQLIGPAADAAEKKRNERRNRFAPRSVSLVPIPARRHPLHAAITYLHDASEKIEVLQARAVEYFRPPSVGVRFVDDADGVHQNMLLVVEKQLPAEFNRLTTEALQYLRSALDTSVSKLIKHLKIQHKRADFPIFLFRTDSTGIPKRTGYLGAPNGGKLAAKLPAELGLVLESVQPFKSGNLRWKHPLATLSALNNFAKHNDIIELRALASESALMILSAPTVLRGGIHIRAGAPLKDGELLARMDKHMKVKPQIVLSCVFRRGCPRLEREDVLPALREMLGNANDILVRLKQAFDK
jgi:hypothetical protein